MKRGGVTHGDTLDMSLRQTSGGHYWQLDQRPWQRGIHVEILFFFLFLFKFVTVHYGITT